MQLPNVHRLALLVVLVSVAAVAQPRPEDIAAGRAQYQKLCTACHGDNATGGFGPDLTSGQWKSGGADSDIIRNIINGIPDSEMPAFPLSTREAEQVVAYLRSLGPAPTRPAPSAATSTGDPEAGRALFFGTAGCSGCHTFGGRGGRLGPDLGPADAPAGRGRRGGTEGPNVRQAIVNPDASLRTNYETVEVTLANGQMLRGVLKNEDTFSIQMMDQEEKLHMLLKSDLRQFEKPKKSLMPASNLNAAQLEDLLAFLAMPGSSAAPVAEWTPSSDLNVTYERLTNTASEPHNWLTYWGDYQGTHYSRLDSITPENIKSLAPKWSFQYGSGNVESSPIVVDGLMFVTGPENNAAALDARTGRPIWRYTRQTPDRRGCAVLANRGFAILGDRLYMGTLDAHLVSLDAKTGRVIWDVEVADWKAGGFAITLAPLAVDGKILVGVAAGECAVTGFIDAYDATTGERIWRTHTVAQKGDPNRATWPNDKAADHGGGPTWTTGTYDPETETVYWPTGNPGPTYDGSVRAGDNLYTNSVLALDPKTGRMKWYFQFTPHDVHDADANETPMLLDVPYQGSRRQLLVQANRNAFYYVIDRETGKFLEGKEFARQNRAFGLDAEGHPMPRPGTTPTPEGVYVCPDSPGATNFGAPSFDPKNNVFIVAVREGCAVFTSRTEEPVPGQGYRGGGWRGDPEVGAPGAIRALDPATGNLRWNFPVLEGSAAAGVLATAGGVVFATTSEGNVIALESGTGKYLWHYQTGTNIKSSPISYAVDGKQYVAVSSGSVLYSFALTE